MKYIKKFEGYFGGTHLGNDQVNTDSAVIKNVTGEPEEYSSDDEYETTSIWTDRLLNWCKGHGIDYNLLNKQDISNILDELGSQAFKKMLIPKILQEIKDLD